MIRYITGDATRPIGAGPRIITHICNDIGGWGKGFVCALSRRWTTPEVEYRAWHLSGDDFVLGAVQFVGVGPELWVANLIGQHGTRPTNGTPPIRYDAVYAGLASVAAFAGEHSASVHMPRIGCGLAGGKWKRIEPLVNETLVRAGVAVTVYDLAN